MIKLLQILLGKIENNVPAALATVISKHGSAPRGPGAMLVADVDGLLGGTVGGGLLEAKTIEACVQACKDHEKKFVEFDLEGDVASEMICGGKALVFVEPFFPADETLVFFKHLVNLLNNGPVTIARPLFSARDGIWAVRLPDGREFGIPMNPELTKIIKNSKDSSKIISLADKKWFYEKIDPARRLFIAGAGHVGLPLAKMSLMCNFDVIIIDDRESFLSKDKFGNAELCFVPEYQDCFKDYKIGELDLVAIITRGHLFDGAVAAQALRTKAGYIGMIGSHCKRDEIFAELRAAGFTDNDVERIHCPIGLDIGSQTPAEIAVSILAQCIRVCRQGKV